MYELLSQQVSLSQGDILDGCPIFEAGGGSPTVDLTTPTARWDMRVLVMTQACDLAQAKAERVVVAIVHPAQVIVDEGTLKASAIRDQVRRGLVFGWYFLPAAHPPISLPESLVDLRDLHTVPRFLLEQLITQGKRICRIVTPYREHLAQHFAVTYSRIALPEPYDTQP